jgi:uncharacterized protein YaeQ
VDRLHRAAKLAPRVAVYVHRESSQWLAGLANAKIHRADALALYALDRAMVGTLAAKLERRLSLAISLGDGDVFVSFASETVSGRVTRLRL